MKRLLPLLLSLLACALGLAATAALWGHERQTQERNLRGIFDLGLRQTANRIEERLAGYEQILRGAQGWFLASVHTDQASFSTYALALLGGADFTGLQVLAYAPRLDSGHGVAPITYVAPASPRNLALLGSDPHADPVRRAVAGGRFGEGWVLAGFSMSELMSSLYGESAPGLTVRVHDGVEVSAATLMYESPAERVPAPPANTPRFKAQEYVAFAGHTWTLRVSTRPEFEQRYGDDSARIILGAGGGLSVLMALLTWLLITGRARAHASARDDERGAGRRGALPAHRRDRQRRHLDDRCAGPHLVSGIRSLRRCSATTPSRCWAAHGLISSPKASRNQRAKPRPTASAKCGCAAKAEVFFGPRLRATRSSKPMAATPACSRW